MKIALDHLLKVAFVVFTAKFCRLYDVWVLGSTANLWTFNSWPFSKHKGLHGEDWGKQDEGATVVKKNLATQDNMVPRSCFLIGRKNQHKYGTRNMIDWFIACSRRSVSCGVARKPRQKKRGVSLIFSFAVFPTVPQLTKRLEQAYWFMNKSRHAKLIFLRECKPEIYTFLHSIPNLYSLAAVGDVV